MLDGTKLFPSDMLLDMLAPVLAGETAAFWLTCQIEARLSVCITHTVPEELTNRAWNMLALAIRPDLQGRRLGATLGWQYFTGLRPSAGSFIALIQ